MGLTLHFSSDALAWFGLPVTTLRSTAGLAAVVVIGMASYGLLAWLLGAFRWHELRAALRQSPKPVTDNSS